VYSPKTSNIVVDINKRLSYVADILSLRYCVALKVSFVATISPFLIHVTFVAGEPVEEQFRMKDEVELSCNDGCIMEPLTVDTAEMRTPHHSGHPAIQDTLLFRTLTKVLKYFQFKWVHPHKLDTLEVPIVSKIEGFHYITVSTKTGKIVPTPPSHKLFVQLPTCGTQSKHTKNTYCWVFFFIT